MATIKSDIEGFVSKDPESRVAGQHTVVTVTVPVEHGRMKDGQWVPEVDQQGQKLPADWWEAEFWNERGAAIMDAVRKGSLVRITGGIPRPRLYQKNDGTPGLGLRLQGATLAVIPRQQPQQAQGATSGQGQGDWAQPAVNGAQGGFQGGGSFDDPSHF